ncbi:MAG: ATP-binding protein [Thermodesulfovibrionales bacterium]
MKQWLLEKRWRILLAGFLTVSLPLVGLTIYVYLQVISQFKQIAVEETRTFFDLAVYHVKEKIDDDISSGRIFAAGPELIKALDKGDRNSARADLKGLLENMSTIERAAITLEDGVMFAEYPENPDAVGIDFSFRDWYRGVSKKWVPYVSDFFLRETYPRRYLFVIAVPIRNQSGKVAGVLVLQPKEDYLKDVLSPMRIGRSFIYVVDRHGNLIYHPEYRLDRIVDFSKIPAVDKVKSGLTGTEEGFDRVHNEPIISTFQPMKWGWGLVMQRPVTEVFHRSREIAAGLILLVTAFLALSGLAAYKGAGLLFSSHRLSLELREKEIYEREMKENLRNELDEHLRTGRKLAETMSALERSNKELEQYAYVASHDLQAPLRRITSFIQLLEERYKGSFDQEAAKYLHHVVDGAKKMQTLINDLLAYSRLGTMGKPFLQTDCNKVLDRVLADLDKPIKSCGAVVTYDALPTVTTDELQLGQVFQNLIGNAVKFCRYTQPRIHVSAKRGDDGWLFSVSDNGIGIEKEFFDRIFVMFQRLHTQAEYPGTGIGLAVCKKIVERHGGRIWAESEVGKGSTFYFTISDRQAGEGV